MAVKTIIRGDSYGIRRPLFTITLVDENSNPFDVSGCTIRTTYKSVATDPVTDPDDTNAPIKHSITIDVGGSATETNGLYLVGAASGGIIEERLTAAESRVLPLATPLISDVEVTDQNGEVFTIPWEDTLTTIDGITNRTT